MQTVRHSIANHRNNKKSRRTGTCAAQLNSLIYMTHKLRKISYLLYCSPPVAICRCLIGEFPPSSFKYLSLPSQIHLNDDDFQTTFHNHPKKQCCRLPEPQQTKPHSTNTTFFSSTTTNNRGFLHGALEDSCP